MGLPAALTCSRPLLLPQSQDPAATVALGVTVLRDLLLYSAQLPELARDISTNHIPGLLTSLLALKPEVRDGPLLWPQLFLPASTLLPSQPAFLDQASIYPPFSQSLGLGLGSVLTAFLPSAFQCQLSTLEGTRACMTHYPRACGSLRVSLGYEEVESGSPVACIPCSPLPLPSPHLLQDKLAAYFLARVDSKSPELQQVRNCR